MDTIKKLVEKTKELFLFKLFVQASLLPTGILRRRYKHYLMPNIRLLKPPKPHAATAPHENRIKFIEMAEESLTERFKDSLDHCDDIANHVCSDTTCRRFYGDFPSFGISLE